MSSCLAFDPLELFCAFSTLVDKGFIIIFIIQDFVIKIGLMRFVKIITFFLFYYSPASLFYYDPATKLEFQLEGLHWNWCEGLY